jgi:hypothetical protein
VWKSSREATSGVSTLIDVLYSVPFCPTHSNNTAVLTTRTHSPCHLASLVNEKIAHAPFIQEDRNLITLN